MKAPFQFIFYWMRKKLPGSKLRLGKLLPKEELDRPIFPDSDDRIEGHIVLLSRDDCKRAIRPLRGTLYVCPGAAPPEMMQPGCCFMLVGDNVGTGVLFNRLCEIFDMFDRWQRQLYAAVNELMSYDAVISSADEVTDAPLMMIDLGFNYIAYSRENNVYESQYVDKGMRMPLDVVTELALDHGLRLSDSRRGIWRYSGDVDIMFRNIFCREKCVGRLGIPHSGDRTVRAYRACVLEILAGSIETLYSRTGTFYRSRDEITRLKQSLAALLGGGRGALSETALSRGCGYEPGDRLCIAQLRNRVTGGSDMPLQIDAQLERLWPGSCCIRYDGRIAALVNLTFYERGGSRFNQALATFLRESLMIAGLSREFTDLSGVGAAYRQAGVAIDLGTEYDPMFWYFRFDDYALRYLMRYGCGDFAVEQLRAPAINILEEYDSRRGTELARTLYTYVRLHFNSVAAAKELYVARSTFIKRMTRISELTGINLDDFAQCTYLQLSYLLTEDKV